MENKLTSMEAFNAMEKFLEIYYRNTTSDDVALLLKNMQLGENSNTFDPSMWHNWSKCIKEVLEEENK